MPNVLSPRDLASRPDNLDKTVLCMLKTTVCLYFQIHMRHRTLFTALYTIEEW